MKYFIVAKMFFTMSTIQDSNDIFMFYFLPSRASQACACMQIGVYAKCAANRRKTM